jgi:hypothetical protein
MEVTATCAEATRRSTRIRAQIPIRLTSLEPAIQFSEQCHTLIVNTQGCGVRLTRPFEPGTPVQLDQLPTGQTATGIVANCVPLGTGARFWLVGIALDQPGNIWGIRPAPADWASEPKAPAAVAVNKPAMPAKSNEWPYTQFSSRGEFHPGRK